MKFILTADYNDEMSRVFTVDASGRIAIGTARSCDRVTNPACLDDWTLFSDYVMEGFVPYQLRLSNKNAGVHLELRLAGPNRDQFIPLSIKQYLKRSGLQFVETE